MPSLSGLPLRSLCDGGRDLQRLKSLRAEDVSGRCRILRGGRHPGLAGCSCGWRSGKNSGIARTLLRPPFTPTWPRQTSKSSVGLSISSHSLSTPTHSHLPRSSFRPLNAIEIRENSQVVVDFDDNLKTITLKGGNAALAGAEKVSPAFSSSPPLAYTQPVWFVRTVSRLIDRSTWRLGKSRSTNTVSRRSSKVCFFRSSPTRPVPFDSPACPSF